MDSIDLTIPKLVKNGDHAEYHTDFSLGPLAFMMKSVAELGGKKAAMERVAELRAAGLDLNAMWRVTELVFESPIHIMVSWGTSDWVDVLAELGADIDKLGASRLSPLFRSAASGSKRCCECLIAHGANVHERNYNNDTLLHVAAAYGRADCLEIIHRAGVSLDVGDGTEASAMPIHWAATFDQSQACEELVRLGVPIDVTDKDLLTSLAYAAYKGHKNTAFKLIDLGASIGHVDVRGRSIAEIARERGHDTLASDIEAYAMSRKAMQAINENGIGLQIKSL